MLVLSLLLVALLGVIVLPLCAVTGHGQRPIYLAVGLIGLLFAGGCALVVPTNAQMIQAIKSGDEAQRLGAQLLYDYAPAGTVGSVMLSVGGFLAAIAYRQRPRLGRPPLPEGEKAIPITIKIRPDVLNKIRAQAEAADIGYQTLINQILEHATR